MDRRFTFSNPSIIRSLQTKFVAVSGDCKELQKGRTATSAWFMNIVHRANEPDLNKQLAVHGDDGDTAQGFYIVGADGKFFGWMNDHDPAEVLAFLSRGLNSFATNPPAPVTISPALLNEEFSARPPPRTSVVRVFTRIRPVPEGSDKLNYGVGRDHLWILDSEVKEILNQSQRRQRFELPQSLVARMVRFNLVDNVRGEPDMWESEEVSKANFSATLIKNDGALKTFQFHGEFAQSTHNRRRGMDGKIDGEFVVDSRATAISQFRAFGEAQTWGASRFTPGAPKGRFPLVIAMVETSDDVSKVVPPQAVDEDYLQCSIRSTH